ncbi:MAG: efflux RND transporter periplasmic adaptor subunit [Nitrospirales bacterium]|nr:efflux RND transporter periplasmic adaptor subunit [Nitrospirales bacterium]
MAIHLIILLSLLLIPACSENPESTEGIHVEGPERSATSQALSFQPPANIQKRIKVVPVMKQLFSQSISAPGGVALDLAKMAKVSSRIEGQVEKIFVQLGKQVNKGDPLLAIGSLQLDELVQEFLVSQVQVELRHGNFKRTQTLHKERIISERRLMEDRARFLEARAVNQHVKEKLQNMGLGPKELDALLAHHTLEGHYYIIRSPLTGTISTQTVVLGQGVKMSDHLFEVVDTQQVWVFANLPIEQAQRFTVGDCGTIIAQGRDPIDAPLAYIAPVADKATLTIQLRFDVDNHQGFLKPNEYVEVRLSTRPTSLLAIPVTALTFVNGRRGVFVRHMNTYTFRPITVGQENDGWIEVIEGVTIGEDIVIHGVFDLKNTILKDLIEGEGH